MFMNISRALLILVVFVFTPIYLKVKIWSLDMCPEVSNVGPPN